MAQIDYLGKGIIFPIELTPQGLPIIRSGPDLIKSSIKMILMWPVRQRIFLGEFGSRIDELLEEPNDDLLKGLVEFFIVDALRTWEKRIDVLDVSVERLAPETIDVEIRYRIKTNQLEDILTFPLYRNAA
jgi:uncharacterized protein